MNAEVMGTGLEPLLSGVAVDELAAEFWAEGPLVGRAELA